MKEVNISVGNCKYCGRQMVLINDYGECPSGCPGLIVNIKEFTCALPHGFELTKISQESEESVDNTQRLKDSISLAVKAVLPEELDVHSDALPYIAEVIANVSIAKLESF